MSDDLHTTHDCLIYYGVEWPDLIASRRVLNTHVVLQPYHPLVVDGLFAEFFPGCSRYLYWDPTQLPERELDTSTAHLKTMGRNATWGTIRLDLRDGSCRRHMIDRARSLLEFEGVEGLFVDGLDAWCDSTSDRDVIARLVNESELASSPHRRWFINRAFPLWRRFPRIDAVLIESLWPDLFATTSLDDVRWMERMLPHLRLLGLRDRPTDIVYLRYDDQNPHENTPDDAPERLRLLANMCSIPSRTIHATRRLDQWPAALRS